MRVKAIISSYSLLGSDTLEWRKGNIHLFFSLTFFRLGSGARSYFPKYPASQGVISERNDEVARKIPNSSNHSSQFFF